MDPDALVDSFRDTIDHITHIEWFSTAVTIVLVVVITAIVTMVLSRILRALLNRGKGPLPASSIFINILRGVMWTVAACIILSSCFGVNVGALVAALGVGGIAVSLAFQSTLSNLISGLQVSLTGLVKPGDHIQVNAMKGIVRDVTWGHTSLIDSDGQHIIIPNSVITSTAITHLLPVGREKVPLYVTGIPEQGGLGQLAQNIESAVNQALEAQFDLKKKATVTFNATDNESFVGSLTFQVADSRKATEAKDIAVRVAAPYIHPENFLNSMTEAEEIVKSTEDFETELAEEEAAAEKKRAEEKAAQKKKEAEEQAQIPAIAQAMPGTVGRNWRKRILQKKKNGKGAQKK